MRRNDGGIRALYLHPDHWRRSHGKRLWQAVAVQMRRAVRVRQAWLLMAITSARILPAPRLRV
jgi:GNAT superfamily N-acetyltransferase